MSAEARAKISAVMKGEGNPMFGRHLVISDETRKKLSITSTGRKHPPRTDEWRKKQHEAKKGKSNWVGKHHSEKTKELLREKNKNWKSTPEIRKKISEKLKGKTFTEEHRRNLSKSQSGENGNNWRGGITTINKKIRNSIDNKLWREAVFARDNYTCQDCGARGVYLNAHHKRPFSKYPELRFAIDNGITLCKPCHDKTKRGIATTA